MSRERRKGLIAVALVAIFLGLLASWLWAERISTSRGEDRDDLELFLDASSAGWAEVTKQFFLVPEVAAQTAGALSVQMDARDDQLVLLAETIRQRPNIDSAYIGYPDGQFYFVARSDEGAAGGFRTRVISLVDGMRQVELTWTDTNLEVVRSEIDPQDTYDPRERPWYEPIQAGVDRNWTAPYVFASSQQPGITHSRAVRSPAGTITAVVGIDIRLSQVNEFLEALSPDDNGSALVVDNTGLIIAESSMEIVGIEPASESGSGSLSPTSDVLRLVRELVASDSDTIRGRSHDGLRTTIVRPAGARDEWYLAVSALDDDFLTDDIASNAFETFAVGVTVAAAFAALGYAVLRYLVELKSDAEIDELTGVYNRRAVKRELRNLLSRSKQSVHVAILDLDNFKSVNDDYGHAAGDKVLVALSQRMHAFGATAGESVGRLGGDEFVVFGQGEMPDWALLIDALAKPIDVGSREFVITASIGIAETGAFPDQEIEDLFRTADHLLFDAKRLGGNQHRSAPVGPA